MITLPTHTFHANQHLYISCLGFSKHRSRNVRDATMVKRNYMELDKIILIGWVDHALDHSLTPKKHVWI